jgi:hypothetical protein
MSWFADRRAVILGVICVAGIVALTGARQLSRSGDYAEADRQSAAFATPEPPPLEQPQAATAQSIETHSVIPPAAPATKPVSAAATRNAKASSKEAVAAEPTNSTPAPRASEPAVEAAPAVREPAALSTAADVGSVTVTGCLTRDADTFWLKDTAGADVPTSRSWKSGFLKKRSARIEVIDGTGALTLSGYVGQQVEATGTLANREMHARSLHRLGNSCN